MLADLLAEAEKLVAEAPEETRIAANQRLRDVGHLKSVLGL